jgi:hypothetical protein
MRDSQPALSLVGLRVQRMAYSVLRSWQPQKELAGKAAPTALSAATLCIRERSNFVRVVEHEKRSHAKNCTAGCEFSLSLAAKALVLRDRVALKRTQRNRNVGRKSGIRTAAAGGDTRGNTIRPQLCFATNA